MNSASPTPSPRRLFWKKQLWLFVPVALTAMFLKLLNHRFPFIGHDFTYLLHQLLVGKWHIVMQGLTPFYYTPYFCGGSVPYGSPNNASYSLLQFAAVYFDSWVAINIAVGFNLLLGYLGWYLVGRRVVRLSVAWSHLLSLLVLTNGFYILHVSAGHWNFIAFSLIGLLLWCLFDRRPDTRAQLVLKVAIFSLTIGLILYSGGYFVLIHVLIAAPFLLALDLLLTRRHDDARRLRTLIPRLIGSAAGAVFISASKLVAVFAMLQIFPRTIGLVDVFPFEKSLLYVAQILFLPAPFVAALRDSPAALGAAWHEFSFFASPIVLVGLVCGLSLLLHANNKHKISPTKLLLALLYAVVTGYFYLQLVSGDGIVITYLREIGIFSSQRVFTRYFYIPAVLITVLATWSLSQFTRQHLLHLQRSILIGSVVVTFASFYWANALTLTIGTYIQRYSYNDWRTVAPQLESTDGLPQRVTHLREAGPLYTGGSGLDCPDVLINGHGHPSGLHRQVLQAGPVESVRDGAFNMMKPACYIFPKENSCEPLDRIPTWDQKNFERFITGQAVNWRVSTQQTSANYLSLVWFVVSAAVVANAGVRTLLQTKTRAKSTQ